MAGTLVYLLKTTDILYCMIATRQGSRALVQPRARNLNYPPLRFIVIRSEHFHEYNTSTCPLTLSHNERTSLEFGTHTLLCYTAPMLSSTSTFLPIKLNLRSIMPRFTRLLFPRFMPLECSRASRLMYRYQFTGPKEKPLPPTQRAASRESNGASIIYCTFDSIIYS